MSASDITVREHGAGVAQRPAPARFDSAYFAERVEDLAAGRLADHRDIWTIFATLVSERPATKFAFHYQDRLQTFTAAELWHKAVALAGSLRHLGLGEGDSIVVQLPNSAETVIALLAAAGLGITYIPVVPIYGAAELGYIIENSGARLLIGPRRWHKVDFEERLPALSAIACLEHIVLLDGKAARTGNVLDWNDLTRSAASADNLGGFDANARAVVLYTSGTTTRPKGVIHAHRTLVADAWQSDILLRHLRHKTLFVGAPAGHMGPILMVIRQLLYAIDGVYLDRWDPAVAARLIDQFAAGWTVGVPMHLDTLLPFARAGKLPTLEMFLVGGTAVSSRLVEDAEAAGIVACRTYGSTEHPTIAQCSPFHDVALRARSDGYLMPGCQVRVLDDEGNDLPPGKPGEILCRGAETFLGYLDSSLDAAAFTPDGWFRTGDLGTVEADGLVLVTGRKKDIIIRGGENISAQEVEDILCRHPAVSEAAVVGWPDEVYGERVGAFVTLKPSATLELPSVIAHFAASGVAKQKTPERLMVLDAFPRNPSGKILKTELRKLAEAASAQGR